MTTPYRQCVRCVMDTSDPEITFDAAGICSHCDRYAVRIANELHKTPEQRAAVHARIEAIKAEGAGKPYDCLIGVSGGVDSTYVAYLAKREFGLRPLAVHFDNGWNSELSVGNIEKTLKTLDIDLVTHVMDWEVFRDLQLSYLRAGVPNVEVPTDHAIGALLFKIAAEKKIRHVISGSNLATEAIMPKAWTYDNRDYHQIVAIHDRFGKRPLKDYPHYGLLRFASYFLLSRLSFVRILNAVDYDKQKAIQVLKDELGWVDYGGKHFESVFTRFYQAYILPKKFGFDKRRAHYSTLINGGQMTREQALADLEKSPYPSEQMLRDDKEFVLKKFELDEAEFDRMMEAPPHLHSDYPSHSLIFNNKLGLLSLAKKIAVGV